jgi:2-methylcitrate dehydratase
MTHVEAIAEFVQRASYDSIPIDATRALKARLLDSLGCALGALDAEPIAAVRRYAESAGGPCTLIGAGRGRAETAALYNGALVRYLDFMDIYMAPKQSGHPSDNVAPVLAAAEQVGATGQELLVALAVAYQIETRLLEAAPVQSNGFDHTVQQAYAVAAAVSKLLSLDSERTAHALAIAGASQQGLVITRVGKLSQWKGIASAHNASGALQAAYLAAAGITGPLEVIEGKRGMMDSLAGEFKIDWSTEPLTAVSRTSLKRYVAEGHAQSAIEGMLELKSEHELRASDVRSISVEIFKQADNIVGSGKEAGDKHDVSTKEQADHSLPYLLAVALLDGEVGPVQFERGRITSADVQDLLRKVTVDNSWALPHSYPEKVPCLLTVMLNNGKKVVQRKDDWLGFFARPASWHDTLQKFHGLSERHCDRHLRDDIANVVATIDQRMSRDLLALLQRVSRDRTPLAVE